MMTSSMDWFELLLLPLTLVYGTLIALRRHCIAHSVFSSGSVRTPYFDGSLHVGGLGKTPLAFHLLERLPVPRPEAGVSLRGYGRTTAGIRLRRPGRH